MGFKKFDWCSWCLALFVGGFLAIALLVPGFIGFWLLGLYNVECGIFSFDTVSFYLSLLSLFLGCSILYSYGYLSLRSKLMLSLSIASSVLCYCCVNGLWFWVFYEMSIFPLLFLLISESPYAERYIASWYLLGYVVFSSLPMLLCIVCLSGILGGYNFQVWYVFGGGSGCVLVFLLLSVMFITKIPLPPFHVWLPIVHAEASSPVSVCLSGYIMKLGLLGVFRFCYVLLPDCVFSDLYVSVGLFFSILFFFSASRELDGKRWLAFLSLAHIVIAALCLNVCFYDNSALAFLYSLGHGLSAGVTFLFLWLVYDLSGSRNWAVLKTSISGSLFLRCLVVACLCSVASIPPTVNFFSEILILCDGGYSLVLFVGLMCVYLFFGGLVPVVLLGCLLTRHYSVSFGSGYVVSLLCSVVFLVVWCYSLFLVF